jgi:aminoglycoside phosphotransferase (APT) family kinase protein
VVARLHAVIDFGGMGVGDPAIDLKIAWFFLEGKAREIFCNEMNMDDDTWIRAKAWGLWKATFDLCEISDKHSSKSGDMIKIINDIIQKM